MNFIGVAKKIEDIDLPRIGATIGVGEDEIHAFMDVEAAGSGFDDAGRPKMLFEPHVFWRELGKGKKQERAAREGLAYAKWQKTGYPKDSYPRLQAAMKIDREAALRSASWGLGQLMGFNHKAAGYVSAEAMVTDFMADEDNQLEAMVRLLIDFKLDDDLRAHRWDTIEQVYNGGGFKGAYARKMRVAFAKWQKIRDTPFKAQEFDDPRPLPEREIPPEAVADGDWVPPEQTPAAKLAGGKALGGGLVVGGAAAAEALRQGYDWKLVGMIAGCAVMVAIIGFVLLKIRKE